MQGQPQASQKSNNYTSVTEFILVGFSLPPQVRYILFTIFFLIYMMTLTANMLIMLAIRMDSTLHTPMYFFLLILSLSETCYTFVIIPNMLATLLATGRAISLGGCALQMYFFLSLAATNCCLLAVMGYDRYVAICHPLRYPVLMNPRVCVQLVAACFFGGFLFPILMVSLIFHVSYCGPNRINHFFCDTSPVLQLACTDSKVPESIVYLAGVIFIIMDLLLILISYIFILTAILKIPSAQGRHKAFSTCAAHLTVVIVHYGCAGIIYLRPKSARSLEEDKLITVSYTVFTPLLNPMVYSLRNKEVRLALQRTLARIFCPQEA
ncbi:olfactory receptor 10T2-like isoform X1 [Alligator mississippiensis]|uniref:olfactory receptor 10T2-like isoform X1 n=2 Tax=Alligator mississippiensis TaxID=8496 RepID=UPI002877822A|nr:olfactory receptor 10T2-like isoform X1 [Alligator mississippiensis]